MSTEPNDDEVPQADSVRWLGLCPCGCGMFKAALFDQDEEPIATFGFTSEGWLGFFKDVAKTILEADKEADEHEHKH